MSADELTRTTNMIKFFPIDGKYVLSITKGTFDSAKIIIGKAILEKNNSNRLPDQLAQTDNEPQAKKDCRDAVFAFKSALTAGAAEKVITAFEHDFLPSSVFADRNAFNLTTTQSMSGLLQNFLIPIGTFGMYLPLDPNYTENVGAIFDQLVNGTINKIKEFINNKISTQISVTPFESDYELERRTGQLNYDQSFNGVMSRLKDRFVLNAAQILYNLLLSNTSAIENFNKMAQAQAAAEQRARDDAARAAEAQKVQDRINFIKADIASKFIWIPEGADPKTTRPDTIHNLFDVQVVNLYNNQSFQSEEEFDWFLTGLSDYVDKNPDVMSIKNSFDTRKNIFTRLMIDRPDKAFIHTKAGKFIDDKLGSTLLAEFPTLRSRLRAIDDMMPYIQYVPGSIEKLLNAVINDKPFLYQKYKFLNVESFCNSSNFDENQKDPVFGCEYVIAILSKYKTLISQNFSKINAAKIDSIIKDLYKIRDNGYSDLMLIRNKIDCSLITAKQLISQNLNDADAKACFKNITNSIRNLRNFATQDQINQFNTLINKAIAIDGSFAEKKLSIPLTFVQSIIDISQAAKAANPDNVKAVLDSLKNAIKLRNEVCFDASALGICVNSLTQEIFKNSVVNNYQPESLSNFSFDLVSQMFPTPTEFSQLNTFSSTEEIYFAIFKDIVRYPEVADTEINFTDKYSCYFTPADFVETLINFEKTFFAIQNPDDTTKKHAANYINNFIKQLNNFAQANNICSVFLKSDVDAIKISLSKFVSVGVLQAAPTISISKVVNNQSEFIATMLLVIKDPFIQNADTKLWKSGKEEDLLSFFSTLSRYSESGGATMIASDKFKLAAIFKFLISSCTKTITNISISDTEKLAFYNYVKANCQQLLQNVLSK